MKIVFLIIVVWKMVLLGTLGNLLFGILPFEKFRKIVFREIIKSL